MNINTQTGCIMMVKSFLQTLDKIRMYISELTRPKINDREIFLRAIDYLY